MAYYAWTDIHYDAERDPNVKDPAGVNIKTGNKTVKVGEEVSAQKLDISKEEFDKLIAEGVVREQKYPIEDARTNPNAGSPMEHMKRKAREELDKLERTVEAQGRTA